VDSASRVSMSQQFAIPPTQISTSSGRSGRGRRLTDSGSDDWIWTVNYTVTVSAENVTQFENEALDLSSDPAPLNLQLETDIVNECECELPAGGLQVREFRPPPHLTCSTDSDCKSGICSSDGYCAQSVRCSVGCPSETMCGPWGFCAKPPDDDEQRYTCALVKQEFQNQGCCGMPSKVWESTKIVFPANGGPEMTCGLVKDEYKWQQCCGLPDKVFLVR